MKLQTERCVQCGTLRRPTDLKSKYDDVLDETGAFMLTDFWFCSDKCFEDVLDKFIDPEYSFKYKLGDITYGRVYPRQESDTPPLSPGLTKKVKTLEGLYQWGQEHNMFSPDHVEDFKKDFGRYPEPDEVPVVLQELINRVREALEDWKFRQDLAIGPAKIKMSDELCAEDIHLFDTTSAKNTKEIEARMERNRREEDRKRKEAEREEEKRKREEERQRREQERLDEKRQREEEKRQKEEAERAAREAEEKKWEPQDFGNI
jgi:Skp family chaperone for outer membrane proteins